MTTKRSKNMLNTVVKISQSLIEHHLQKNTNKILVKLRIIKTNKIFYSLLKNYIIIHVHVYVFIKLYLQ